MLPKRKPLYKDVCYFTHKTSSIITQRMISTYNTKVNILEYSIQKGKNNYRIILFVEVEKVIQITKSFAEFN